MKLTANILMGLLAASAPVWSHGEMKSNGYYYPAGSKRHTGKAAEKREAKRRKKAK